MFVDSDTVSEFKSEDGAIHVIERRCKLDIDAPRLLKKVAGEGHWESEVSSCSPLSHGTDRLPPFSLQRSQESITFILSRKTP